MSKSKRKPVATDKANNLQRPCSVYRSVNGVWCMTDDHVSVARMLASAALNAMGIEDEFRNRDKIIARICRPIERILDEVSQNVQDQTRQSDNQLLKGKTHEK